MKYYTQGANEFKEGGTVSGTFVLYPSVIEALQNFSDRDFWGAEGALFIRDPSLLRSVAEVEPTPAATITEQGPAVTCDEIRISAIHPEKKLIEFPELRPPNVPPLGRVGIDVVYREALLHAVSVGDVNSVRWFLQNGVPAGLPGPAPPLHRAASRSDIEMIDLLLDYGADPDQPGWACGNALGEAVDRGCFKTLGHLIKRGAKQFSTPCSETSPIHRAAKFGNTPALLVMLARGAPPQIATLGVRNVTPLVLAAKYGRYECAEALLAAGASPQYVPGSTIPRDNHYGVNLLSPLVVAFCRGDRRMIKLLGGGLPKRTAPPRDQSGDAHAHKLCAAINDGSFAALVAKGAREFTHPDYKLSPLHHAIRYRKREAVKLMLEHGADANYATVYSKNATPLFVAARRNDRECAKMLMDVGASPDLAPCANLVPGDGRCYNPQTPREAVKHRGWAPMF